MFKNPRDPVGATPFQACVEQGLTKTVQELLKRHLAESLSSGEYAHSLHTAARYGWKELVELLSKYINLNSKDLTGKYPIHVAIDAGQTEIVRCLLKQNPRAVALIYEMPIGKKATLRLTSLA